MKYFGGCDVGSTYTKAVILDENGKMVADTTIKSKINSEASAVAAMAEVCEKAGLALSATIMFRHVSPPALPVKRKATKQSSDGRNSRC